MKQFLLAFFCLGLTMAKAQTALPEADKSPMDMCYYPVNFPLLKVQNRPTDPLVARVVYSRPKREGRPIFGSLVEYGKLWRLGANEATEIEFYKPVTIDNKKVGKGRYTLYAIVNEKYWTLIINKETDVWGSFKYDQAKDAARIDVPVEKIPQSAELLSMTFEKVKTGIQLVIAWETTRVALPISY